MGRRAALAATLVIAAVATAIATSPATRATGSASTAQQAVAPPAPPTATASPLAPAPPTAKSPAATASQLAASPPLATASPTPTPGADLAWTLPTGWRAVGPWLTALGEPAHRLAAATFDLRLDEPDGDCSPTTAHRRLPPHGALVFLVESRDWEGSLPRLPARPARLRVPRAADHECFGHARVLWWGEQDRSLTAVVLLGRRAGPARRAQAEALLNSLVVQRVPPPPPPAGWRSAISASDSLRVPPGWSAYALARQRGVARPRLLFRVANSRVVLRVVEHRRGPASPAFPPASEPLVFDARRRAALHFRGYRISLRIMPRAGATAQDLQWAELSARSLGVSSVGRG